MNRPFGAVDVAANLKGAVPKATTQKILIALAEKGEIVQKTYGAYFSVPSLVIVAKLNICACDARQDNILCCESGQSGRRAR